MFRFHATQLDNPVARWILSEGFSVVYADIEGEMVVGGVFLRLFVANPGWVLRKPKEFMTELLEKWSEIVSVNNPNVCHLFLLKTFKTLNGLLCADVPLRNYSLTHLLLPDRQVIFYK